MSIETLVQQDSMPDSTQLIENNNTACFHCGDKLPLKGTEFLIIEGQKQAMCCSGCNAVAQYIIKEGLADYYKYRKQLPQKIKDSSLLSAIDWQVFDQFSTNLNGTDVCESLLDIEGMHCVSCAWLVQHKLEKLGDVKVLSLDHQTGVAIVRWHRSSQSLGKILHSINALGYIPHLIEQDDTNDLKKNLVEINSEDSLKRLVVAGLGMMQVMMFAVALYTGNSMNMETVYRRFLVWVSMLVTFPVLFYSGRPFLKHAIQSIRASRMHMDIPISVALLSAFSLSVVNSFLGYGEVYFDSVVMFVFFLSVSRYIQERITRRMITSRQAFARMLPVLVEVEEEVAGTQVLNKKPTGQLLAGERIAIPIGGVIPADGTILSGSTEIDAAWISGESKLLKFAQGDSVYAGMVNITQPIQIQVSKNSTQSALSILSQRLRRSEYTSTEHKMFASRYVTVFVAITLILAAIVFTYWTLQNEWHKGFEIALAVLVVSCPCALAIAMPSSVASLTTTLHDLGIYVINPHKLLNLTRISAVILDKTGTLTKPFHYLKTIKKSSNTNTWLSYAKALSNFTEHPKARFLHSTQDSIEVNDIQEVKGAGISGVIEDTRYYLGRPDFVATIDSENIDNDQSYLGFGDGKSQLLLWDMNENLHKSAELLVQTLQENSLNTILCSGDRFAAVKHIADQLQIDKFYAEKSSEDKLALIDGLKKSGEVVLSIGDGVNDAEFLKHADLSVSFTKASELAQANADILLADHDLSKILILLNSAKKLKIIYRQNITWAITYNLIMVPLAVMGFIVPWMAALGMSLSSIFVVLNSLRLSRMPIDSNKGILQSEVMS